MPSAKQSKAEPSPRPKGAADSAPSPDEVVETQPPERSWRTSWPVPLLIAGVVALAAGLFTSASNKPKPDFDAMLAGVQSLVDSDKYAQAITELNEKVAPYLASTQFQPEHRQQFHTLRARIVHLGQKSIGLKSEKNYRTILREFAKAVEQGATLGPADMSYIAEAHIELEHYEEAARVAGAMPKEEGARRGVIFRSVVDRLTKGEHADVERAMKILDEFGGRSDLTPDERVEGVALECDLLMTRSLHEEAIDLLLRALATEDGAGPQARGELFLQLGTCYFAKGDMAEAEKNLKRATTLLTTLDPKSGDATNMLARIDLSRGEAALAREKFTYVADKYAQLAPAAGGFLGVAEASAVLGEDDSALAALEAVSDMAKAGWETGDVTREALVGLMMTIQEARFEAGKLDIALEYAKRAEALYTFDEIPAGVLTALSNTHRRIAEEQLGDSIDRLTGVVELAHLPPADREQARRHYLAAGAYARALGGRLVLSSNSGYRDALWLAADSFDRGGDATEALRCFLEYADEFQNDPHQAESRYRAARIYQSRGEYPEAAGRYASLIEDSRAPGHGAVGPLATASYVPLAQCLILDSDPANDAEAERLLRHVLDGEFADPSSEVFQEAAVAYGEMLYEQRRYAEAIERLVQASSLVSPDTDGARSTSVNFRLADSYRQSATEIRRKLESEGMPAHESERLDLLRRERFSRAAEQFAGLIETLTHVDPSRLTPLERVYLRNAYFYRGDCAYELALSSAGEERERRFSEAILSYEEALERYVDDPAALVAMIQITHCYLKRGSPGDVKRGWTVADRARRLYASMDPQALNDPTLPLSREDWERWLDSIETLASLANGEEEH